MTYLRFHLIFNLPVFVLLVALNWSVAWTADEIAALCWVMLAVMIFTTPWDNLAAKWGIWGFPKEKYLVKIGYLPIEEYAFFLLQSLNVILAFRALFLFFPTFLTGQKTDLNLFTGIYLGASIVPWLLIAFQLWKTHRKHGAKANYALHLSWFLPVIYLQWVIAPYLFFHHSVMLILIMTSFGIYYTLADIIAVKGGTWFFDEKQITGVKLAGILPWEEIAFFFLTSLLVAQSYLLLLPSDLR